MSVSRGTDKDALWPSTAVLTLLSIAGAGAGFLREMAVARAFGTSFSGDAFAVAMFFFDTINVFVVTGVASFVLVPRVAGLAECADAAEERQAIAAFFTLMAVASVGLTLLIVAGAPQLLKAMLPRWPAPVRQDAIRLVQYAAPAFPLLAVAGLLAAILQGLHRFMPPAGGRIALNSAVAVSLVFLVPSLGLGAGAPALIAGAGAQLAVIAWAITRSRFSLGLTFSFHHRVTSMVRATLPALSTVFLTNFVLGSGERLFLSHLGEGSMAACGYASRLFYMLLSWGVALQTVSFAHISREVASPTASRDLADVIMSPLRAGTLVLVPVGMGTWILRQPLVAAVYMRGQFDSSSLGLTALALSGYALALAPGYLVGQMIRVLFAFRDARSAVLVACVWCGSALALDMALLPKMGIAAIPTGFALGACAGAVIGVIRLERKITVSILLPYSRYLARVSLLAAPACLPLVFALPAVMTRQGALSLSVSAIFALSVAALLACGIFFVLARRTGLPGVEPLERLLGLLRGGK